MSTIDRLNRFVKNPVNLDISRSKFNRPFTHKTTFKSGKLIPLYLDEVLPGDTFKVKWSSVVRMLTPAVPVMDNAFMDIYFFFVPFRLCTYGANDWQKVQGENFAGPWAPSTESSLENTSNMASLRTIIIHSGSVANYFGLPIGAYSSTAWDDLKINLMPFNAYIRIWNEWFRDQNTQPPKSILYSGDRSGLVEVCYGCFDVNKLHDYFTSTLPAPQKGDSVLLPLGSSAPVLTASNPYSDSKLNKSPLMVRGLNNNTIGDMTAGKSPVVNGDGAGHQALFQGTSGSLDTASPKGLIPANLYADLSQATATSVNQMRQAFAIQRLLEKDARGGTRYREMLKAHFGVTIPDLTVQVPEYLGGKRFPLNITQVLQTSQTSEQSPLGATGAFSNTAISDYAFIKSFNEYGYIMAVGCVRTEQSYSQGIPKLFTRNRRYDFYLPVFANLGEQPVYSRELYVDTQNASFSQLNVNIFGYQEAWADYRYHPNMVTGNLAPNANDKTLTAWTYTNKFTAQPVLNSSFMVQPSSQIGDTLVVTDTETQFVADFFFDVECTRPMPLYSIPGLIDHH